MQQISLSQVLVDGTEAAATRREGKACKVWGIACGKQPKGWHNWDNIVDT
jgi:hypothetical protein